MSNGMLRPALTALTLLTPATGQAESFDDVVRAELRPGWRLADGDHIAALHLELAPGWKTYWRAPGDAGIPPVFDWRAARDAHSITVSWPTPDVFWQSGMRSVGYDGQVVLPLRIALREPAQDMRLKGVIDLGICKDVCLPHRVRVEAVLPADAGTPDPMIAAALADVPFTAAEAGVSAVRCSLAASDSGISLTARIAMPAGTGREQTVIEAGDPQIWVAEPQTRWDGGELVSQARMLHAEGGVFALDRSAVRITVLGGHHPIDIQGCDG